MDRSSRSTPHRPQTRAFAASSAPVHLDSQTFA